MATVTTILKKTRTEAIIKFVGAGTTTVNLSDVALSDETLSTAKVDIHQVRWTGGTADTISITRNSVEALHLTGSGDWEFNGYSISENNTFALAVTLSANSTLILTLRKVGGYVSPDRAYLTGGA